MGLRRPAPPDDLALLPDADPEGAERARVATTTERLIRTQTATLKEFAEVLEDADEIADAIKDLEVQRFEPRGRRKA